LRGTFRPGAFLRESIVNIEPSGDFDAIELFIFGSG
jgi:hypothetical protein